MLILKPVSHPKLGEIRVRESLFRIGRRDEPFASCEREAIQTPSSRHACIFEESGFVYLADLGRINGTQLNDARIGRQPVRLARQDRIVFGGELVYDVELISSICLWLFTANASAKAYEGLRITEFPHGIDTLDAGISPAPDRFGNHPNMPPGLYVRIDRTGDTLSIRNLGSQHRILINDKRLDANPVRLRTGDDIAVGEPVLLFSTSIHIETVRAAPEVPDSMPTDVPEIVKRNDRCVLSVGQGRFEDVLMMEDNVDTGDTVAVAEESHSVGGSPSDEVQLGSAVPQAVAKGESFVARFVAYTDSYRDEIERILDSEAPTSKPRLNLDKCRWQAAAKVTVRLAVDGCDVAQPVKTFRWSGTWTIVRFDVHVLENTDAHALIVAFDVAVEGLPIATLRPEIELIKFRVGSQRSVGASFVSQQAPSRAFASYASKDRREVLGRVRSLQIFTGIDVFLDCLSMQPGCEWKPTIRKEIDHCDIFWLFWSRHAMRSEWVDWEWRSALEVKSLSGIQPHPLEPSDLAPAPVELSDLQFGAVYEWYLSHLRESWLTRRLREIRRRIVVLRDRWYVFFHELLGALGRH